jgi:methionyl-tRNA formyltransferase
MQMDAGLDTGPILSQRSIPLMPEDTAGSVFEKLSHLGADLLLETLPDYLSGKLKPIPQPQEGATYAPMLKKEEGQLDFDQDVHELERKVRAFSPWPGTFMDVEGMLLKVHRARVEAGDAPVGKRLVFRNEPAVAAQGGLLILEEVRPAGKKSMSGRSFLAGARGWA